MTNRKTRKSIAYARVSTADQTLGLQNQLERCNAAAVAFGYLPCESVSDIGVSGGIAPEERPGLAGALDALDAGSVNVLIVTSIDRLGRRSLDVLKLADRAERNGWALVVLDLSLDTATPVGAFTLRVLSAIAEFERDLIRTRTRAAMATAKANGVRFGRPVSDATRTAGVRAAELRESGRTYAAIGDTLAAEGYQPRGGGDWYPQTVKNAIRSVGLDSLAAKNAGQITS